jgi:protein-tyrosine phosphatase
VTVLFVCYGNICRSPMAEALLRRAAADRVELRDVEVSSAGVAAIEGNRAAPLACATMRAAFGVDLSAHRARQLLPTTGADLVLALDEESLRAARRLRLKVRVVLLGDYAGTGEEVDDPYGGVRDEYEAPPPDRAPRASRCRAARHRETKVSSSGHGLQTVPSSLLEWFQNRRSRHGRGRFLVPGQIFRLGL